MSNVTKLPGRRRSAPKPELKIKTASPEPRFEDLHWGMQLHDTNHEGVQRLEIIGDSMAISAALQAWLAYQQSITDDNASFVMEPSSTQH